LSDNGNAYRFIEMVPFAEIRRRARIGAVVLLTTGLLGCRPELVVRFATTVYHDGSVGRVLEFRGELEESESDGKDWLANSGVSLADPGAWTSVEQEPGRLRAEGFFLTVDDLPPLFAVDVDDAPRPARFRTRLDIQERVVLTRWVYTETHGDPYSSADSARALDGLIQLIIETLREELFRHFGEDVDTLAAEEFFRSEARALAWAMLTVNRGSPGWERMEARATRWTQLLQQHGLPVRTVAEDEDFWDVQMPVMLDWMRRKVAAALSTGEATVRPGELTFWPAGDDWERQATEIVERVWGSEDELYEKLEPHLAAMAGFYSGDDTPRFRFESRVRMPGTVLRTNGTPDDDSVVWLFRQQDLTVGDFVLRAEAVEPVAKVLTDLGARREFDRAELVRLADILWRQDPDGGLVTLLEEAVSRGRLDPLRDEDAVPAELQDLAAELADLLDPEVPSVSPL
jgi:hypothetical protein